MTPESEDNVIQALCVAVRQAGAAMMELWPGARLGVVSGSPEPQSQRDELGIIEKADGSPVSRADMRSNEILCGAIARLAPGQRILSEELPCDPDELAKSECVWVIDPLDGTSAFLRGDDDFSILVARCEKQLPKLGVMYFPARDWLVVARDGAGASRNGERLRVSTHPIARSQRVYIRNFSEAAGSALASPMMDSGLALLKVASGDLDGAIIKMTTHREWDIAAPISAIQEAGGRVSDEKGREVRCGLGLKPCLFFVASNGLVHEELLAFIKSTEHAVV